MIYAHAILTGYTSLRGSPTIHAAMFIAMLIFIRVPEDVDNSFAGGNYWYPFAVCMHLILAILTFSAFMTGITTIETVKTSTQMIAVLAEILNFTTMVTLYDESKETHEEFPDDPGEKYR